MWLDSSKPDQTRVRGGEGSTTVAKMFTCAAEGDENKIDKVLQKFTEYFESKKFLKAYVSKFQQRVHKPNESLQDYITAVRNLAAECEFGDLCERQVCIQISNGVRDQKLKEKLWEDDLSLDDVIKRCHQFDQLLETHRIHATESAQVLVKRICVRYLGLELQEQELTDLKSVLYSFLSMYNSSKQRTDLRELSLPDQSARFWMILFIVSLMGLIQPVTSCNSA